MECQSVFANKLHVLLKGSKGERGSPGSEGTPGQAVRLYFGPHTYMYISIAL